MDQVTLVKSEFRLQQWADIINSCQSSGQTVVAWCEENGINIKTYYYWLRKLRLRMMNEQSLPAARQSESLPCLKKLEVQVPVSNTQTAVMIHLPTATLEIRNGASQQTFEAVLLALKSVCQLISQEQRKSIWPVVIPTCASLLMVWQQWSNNNSNWIHFSRHCFFSVAKNVAA